jgi:hypothetical protein
MLSSSQEAGPDISPKLERIRDLLLFQRASQTALAEGYFLFIGTVPKTPAQLRPQPPDSSQRNQRPTLFGKHLFFERAEVGKHHDVGAEGR